MGILSRVAPAATVFLASSNNDTTNGTSFSWASQGTGPTTVSHKVVVICMATGPSVGSVTGCTIGGVSASSVVAVGTAEAATRVYELDGVTSTSATIAFTTNGTSARAGFIAYAIYDGAAASTDSYAVTISSTPNPGTYDTVCPAGGVIIAATHKGSSSTVAWAGVTEDVEATDAEGQTYGGASDAFATEQIALTVSATTTGTSSGGFAVASWGPA